MRATNRWGPSRLPDSPAQLIRGLLEVCREQERCLDGEDLDRFLELAERRDDLQCQLVLWEDVPEDLLADLRQVWQAGERILARLAQLAQHWNVQETLGHRQAQGLKQYVAEGQSSTDPHFLDRLK